MSRREGPQRTTRRGPLTSSTNLLTDATHATVEKVLMCGYYNLLPRLLPQPEPQVQTSPDPLAAIVAVVAAPLPLQDQSKHSLCPPCCRCSSHYSHPSSYTLAAAVQVGVVVTPRIPIAAAVLGVVKALLPPFPP